MFETSAFGFGASEHAPEELQMQRVLSLAMDGATDNSAHLLCDLREREGREQTTDRDRPTGLPTYLLASFSP